MWWNRGDDGNGSNCWVPSGKQSQGGRRRLRARLHPSNRLAKPWRAGEVAPMKVRVVQQVHENTVSHWRTPVVQRNLSTGVDGRWWSGRACEVCGIRKEIKPAAEMS